MPTPPHRRWFQFGLRTMFVVVTATALWLGWAIAFPPVTIFATALIFCGASSWYTYRLKNSRRRMLPVVILAWAILYVAGAGPAVYLVRHSRDLDRISEAIYAPIDMLGRQSFRQTTLGRSFGRYLDGWKKIGKNSR